MQATIIGLRSGSSPLARGLRCRRELGPRVRGIIPARAGFTSPRTPRRRTSRDHPRSRGVYMTAAGTSTGSAGSSPLARGLRPVAGHRRIHLRIIPARAGFTVCLELTKSRHRDHPRSRGVYVLRAEDGNAYPGSSPLARGLHQCIQLRHLEYGIIPARAGFTTHEHRPDGCAADHPRSRGVYIKCITRLWPTAGSSPLARGLPPTTAS